MRKLVVALAILLAACAAPVSDSSYAGRNVALATDFDLPIGEKVGIEGTQAFVRFERVLEESRCPMNARCIWEGNARIAILVEEISAVAKDKVEMGGMTLELNTSERFARRQPFGKLDVVLVHLEPTPMAGEKVDKYVATLRVEARP
ncbi:MAG: hypothetical protein H7Y89_14235 [Steroidobacteraceae bacterium]|nr:hypothetical protein [Steroidobacteraceae bacterium]